MRHEVLKKFNFFILDVSKVCQDHLRVDAWANVNQFADINNFTTAQINRVFEMLQDSKQPCEQNASTGFYNPSYQLQKKFLNGSVFQLLMKNL